MKKNVLIKLLFVFVLFSGCEKEELLVQLECIPGNVTYCDGQGRQFENNVRRQGSCSWGEQVCSYEGWSECKGIINPSEEICDGRDNNCDGQIDETYPELTELCGMQENINYGIGICKPGVYTCNDGVLYCIDHIGPSPDVCDGIDNDCNGVVDDSSVERTITACYDADPSTILVGECRAGIRYCSDGNMDGPCDGQVIPTIEICDNKDNDCDGEVDEGFDSTTVDLVFIVDISGSFDDEIERTIYGIAPLLEDDVTLDFRFSLIIIGSCDSNGLEGSTSLMNLMTDFVERDQFLEHLEAALILSRGRSCGREPSYDAIIDVINNTFNLSFREVAHKVIVLMTDEEGQSFRNIRVSESDVANARQASNFIVHVYNVVQHIQTFASIVNIPSNLHPLEDYRDANSIFESLRRIFLNICIGD